MQKKNGSETDAGAVITNPATEEKTGVFGTGTMPVLAIIDPELMRSVPAKFKAYQGFDALFHSTEGVISNKRNEMSKMVASEAIRNVSGNLAAAIREPEMQRLWVRLHSGAASPAFRCVSAPAQAPTRWNTH